MATRTVVTLTDDIDGSEASETVVFGLDGTTYEIDLHQIHAEELREMLAPYISVARPLGRASSASSTARPRRSAQAGEPGAVDTRAVRAWAEANGVRVSSRGRIKADVLERYKAATG